MNRRLSPILVCTVALFFGLAGCQKSSDQSASNDPNAAPSAADSSSPSGGGGAKKAGSSASAPAPAPKPVVVPVDTVISVVNDEPLSSKTSTSGQRFKATVEKEIEIDGKVVIAKGAHATGMVKDAKPAGRFKGGSALELTLISVEGTDGKEYDVQTSSPTLTHAGKGKRTAVLTGGGGAAGALIGGLAGGGKGALIGAVVGAGAGGAGSAFTGKADVVVAAESGLSFKLIQPLEIKRR
jgi:hypothetical protein